MFLSAFANAGSLSTWASDQAAIVTDLKNFGNGCGAIGCEYGYAWHTGI